MKWSRTLWMFVLALCLGCSSEGGPVGTGISTSAVTGNVIAVQTDTSTGSASALPAVQVSIDGVPGAQTTTDSAGNFQLMGSFFGIVTLRFSVSQYQVTRQLNVPSGSTVVLQDLDVTPTGADAQAVRQLGFIGIVDMVDCTDGTLLAHDQRHSGVQLLVQLSNSTTIAAANGQPLTCGDLDAGMPVEVDGLIQADGTITALMVTVAPRPAAGAQPVRQVPLVGTITVINCTPGLLIIDDSQQRSRVQLTQTTSLVGPTGSPLTCADLQLGESIRGLGEITLKMPGTIAATKLTVTALPTPGMPIRFFGFVTMIDCPAGTMELAEANSLARIDLLPNTTITRNNQQPLQCSDIQPGYRVTGQGVASPNVTGAIDAATVVVTPRGPGQGMGGPSSTAF